MITTLFQHRVPRTFLGLSLALVTAPGVAIARAQDDGGAVGQATERGFTQRSMPEHRRPPAGVLLDDRSLADAAAYSEAHAGRALLVLAEGESIFERYARGWTADRPHALASGTKSFTGLLAMAAIEDGLIASLDERVAHTLEEWQDDPDKRDVRVHHLLELSSGLAPEHDSLGPRGAGIRDLGPEPSGPLVARWKERLESLRPPDRFAAAVGIPSRSRPGVAFAYGPSHFYAFGELLRRKLTASERDEDDVFAYLVARVLAPCDIRADLDRFAPDEAGNPNLPGGGHLTAREWARFGEFVRLGGAARDEAGELVRSFAPGALDPCFEPSATNGAYGRTWWLLTGTGTGSAVADGPGAGRSGRWGAALRRAAQTQAVLDAAGEPIAIAMAAGAGKQRLYLLPDLGLAVVRFAENGLEGRGFDDGEFLRALLGLDRDSRAGSSPRRDP